MKTKKCYNCDKEFNKRDLAYIIDIDGYICNRCAIELATEDLLKQYNGNNHSRKK